MNWLIRLFFVVTCTMTPANVAADVRNDLACVHHAHVTLPKVPVDRLG